MQSREITDILSQAWQEIAARPSGPFAFRFYLQPLMAAFLAVRDGLRDARAGEPPYFWSLFTDAERRGERIRAGWASIGRVVLLALALDTIYQLVVLRSLRIGEGIFIAILLAITPYLLVRGLVTRLARRRIGPQARGPVGGTRPAPQEGSR